MAQDWTKLPPIELRDETMWRNHQKSATTVNQRAIMTFAERWAQLMQVAISKGKALTSVAEQLEGKTEVEGLASSQFQYALGLLVKCWRHGEELRQFYNLKYGGAQGAAANAIPGRVIDSQLFNI